MAKGVSPKLKLLYLVKILLEKTDENHGITMEEILDLLRQNARLSAEDIASMTKKSVDEVKAIKNKKVNSIPLFVALGCGLVLIPYLF